MSAVHMVSIDLYHCVPFSKSLTLPEGHKVSGKQILLVSFSHKLLQLPRMKSDVALKQLKFNILALLQSEIDVNCNQSKQLLFFTDCIKHKLSCGHAFQHL